MKGLYVDSFLITPVQRILKYKLLILIGVCGLHLHKIQCNSRSPIGYSVIVALTGLPIGYSVTLTDLPIGYSVIVALTGLPIGYSTSGCNKSPLTL